MAKQWIVFAIGFWILFSPWILDFSEISLAKWSNVVFGLILIIMSTWGIFGSAVRRAEFEKGRAEGESRSKNPNIKK